MLAVLSPGQGAQAPGMLAPWLEIDAARDSIAQSSEAAGLDLATLGTTADADTIRDTSVAQPLLVASALAAFAALGWTWGRARFERGVIRPLAGLASVAALALLVFRT